MAEELSRLPTGDGSLKQNGELCVQIEGLRGVTGGPRSLEDGSVHSSPCTSDRAGPAARAACRDSLTLLEGSFPQESCTSLRVAATQAKRRGAVSEPVLEPSSCVEKAEAQETGRIGVLGSTGPATLTAG